MWKIRSGRDECGKDEGRSVEDKRVNSRIKCVRLRFSLTQGQLGQKIGRTAAYINQIERGKVEPTETVINTIADVLEIDTTKHDYINHFYSPFRAAPSSCNHSI